MTHKGLTENHLPYPSVFIFRKKMTMVEKKQADNPSKQVIVLHGDNMQISRVKINKTNQK